MSSRISGWFVLSAVFIVAVFGLFFTFTERKTWPEHRIELSATDQRLVPPASTVWCEAIALHSEHPFVAYQVKQSPLVNPSHLNKQKVSVALKLGGGRSRNSFKLKYFLLTSSVLELFACAAHEGARLLVFQGDEGVEEYLREAEEVPDSDSSEEAADHPEERKSASVVRDVAVEVGDGDEPRCFPPTPLRINITREGFYVIAALNTNAHESNHFSLHLLIDRSRYTIAKSGHSFDMCSLATHCTIGLSFGSDEGALVWIPEEPNAGRSSFTIRSRCKPRLAVFAILSVFLPLMFFVLVAFFVRADRERRVFTRHPPRTAVPLLTREEPCPRAGNERDELPPPYDPPPPYTCTKP